MRRYNAKASSQMANKGGEADVEEAWQAHRQQAQSRTEGRHRLAAKRRRGNARAQAVLQRLRMRTWRARRHEVQSRQGKTHVETRSSKRSLSGLLSFGNGMQSTAGREQTTAMYHRSFASPFPTTKKESAAGFPADAPLDSRLATRAPRARALGTRQLPRA